MVFSKSITVPKNTSITSPLITTVRLGYGLMYQFDLYFPPGPSGLVGVWIEYHGDPLYPNVDGTYFRGDNMTISFPDTHFVDTDPYEVVVKAFNTSINYAHSFDLRFGIAPTEEEMSRYVPAIATKGLTAAMAQIQESRAAGRRSSLDALQIAFGRREA